MTNYQTKLEALATKLVEEREKFYRYKLPKIDRAFLVRYIAEHMHRIADKFVKGSLEHNPGASYEESFIVGCDHMMELDQESIDLPLYSAAAQYRRAYDNNKTRHNKTSST